MTAAHDPDNPLIAALVAAPDGRWARVEQDFGDERLRFNVSVPVSDRHAVRVLVNFGVVLIFDEQGEILHDGTGTDE